jgi:DNA-binding MurR/RpiR family transcriptional regulator
MPATPESKIRNNPIAELADIQLFISTLEKSIRSGAMASRIAQLNVIDIFNVGIAGCHYEESVKSLEMTGFSRKYQTALGSSDAK